MGFTINIDYEPANEFISETERSLKEDGRRLANTKVKAAILADPNMSDDDLSRIAQNTFNEIAGKYRFKYTLSVRKHKRFSVNGGKDFLDVNRITDEYLSQCWPYMIPYMDKEAFNNALLTSEPNDHRRILILYLQYAPDDLIIG